MNILDSNIDVSLKNRLGLLLSEFESYRVKSIQLFPSVIDVEEIGNNQIKESNNSFLRKFFFSDFYSQNKA